MTYPFPGRAPTAADDPMLVPPAGCILVDVCARGVEVLTGPLGPELRVQLHDAAEAFALRAQIASARRRAVEAEEEATGAIDIAAIADLNGPAAAAPGADALWEEPGDVGLWGRWSARDRRIVARAALAGCAAVATVALWAAS